MSAPVTPQQVTEATLRALLASPGYYRDRHPALCAAVAAAFRDLCQPVAVPSNLTDTEARAYRALSVARDACNADASETEAEDALACGADACDLAMAELRRFADQRDEDAAERHAARFRYECNGLVKVDVL